MHFYESLLFKKLQCPDLIIFHGCAQLGGSLAGVIELFTSFTVLYAL